MKKRSLFAGAAALALSVASVAPALNAWAATSTTYNSDVTTMPIKRTISNVSNAVANTFTYTITADGTNPAGANNEPTSATITFNNVAPANGTAMATGTIDFSSTTFSQIGDYYYTVTETGSSDTTNYPIDSTEYRAMLSVRYAVGANNVPDNNSLVVTLVQDMVNLSTESSSGDKEEAIWTSGAERTYVEVNTTTTGNSAETSKCFAYTIDIPASNGVIAGDVFTIASDTECAGGATTVTAGTTATIYLKHGDSATIGHNGTTDQLPIGASYTITKSETGDGYSTTIDSNNVVTVTKTTVATNHDDFSTDNVTNVINDRNITPLTGIVTNVWTYVVLLAAGGVGMLYASRKASKKE